MSIAETLVKKWLDEVVIGLGLCPFAAKPLSQGRIRIVISQCASDNELLEDLEYELSLIDQSTKAEVETTLLVIEEYLQDFSEFNQFLDAVDNMLELGEWEGKYQIATFHPDYQFAGTHAEDAENLTNRAPYPILHILSEQNVSEQLEYYSNPEDIPKRNIERMNALSTEEIQKYFAYLFN